MERVKDLDLYLLLEVDTDADVKTIKKAYRKKALTCHPDKNPDNPKAVALFHQLSDALEVLADENARKAYDNVLKARKATEVRNRELDGKRRKLKDDLEAREKLARDEHERFVVNKQSEYEKLQAEIVRLRREGSKQLEEEQEAVRKQLEDEMKNNQNTVINTDTSARIKVRWQRGKDVDEKSAYTKESLETVFTKYGEVTAVVVNDKKCSALVEFEDLSAAKMASTIETGFVSNPLKIKPLFEQNSGKARNENFEFPSYKSFGGSDESKDSAPTNSGATGNSNDTDGKNIDFESLVMRKLRQEEERKKLIQQMMEEDQKEN